MRTRARSSLISTSASVAPASPKRAAGRLRYGRPEGRAHSSAALPPRVDLEDLAALEHREAGLAAYERCQFPFLAFALAFLSGLGVEEVEAVDVDRERDTVADAIRTRGSTRATPSAADAPAMSPDA